MNAALGAYRKRVTYLPKGATRVNKCIQSAQDGVCVVHKLMRERERRRRKKCLQTAKCSFDYLRGSERSATLDCSNSFSSALLELIHCLRRVCASPFINKNVAAVKDLSRALSFDCAKLMRVKINFIIKRARGGRPLRANGALTPCMRDNIYSGNYLYGNIQRQRTHRRPD